MQKPITVLYEDFSKSLIDLINNNGLPAFITVSVLRDMTEGLKPLVKKQSEENRQQYENSVKAEKEEADRAIKKEINAKKE